MTGDTPRHGLHLPRLPPARETRRRSLAKAVSWRFLGTIDTIVLAYLFTGNLKVSTAIGLTEVGTKLVLYFLHERAWARVGRGLPSAPEPPATGEGGGHEASRAVR